MIQLGVRISPIFIGSNSIERFDFFDPYGTRLTVIRDRNLDSSVAGAVGLSMPIISVSDLEPSRAWYAKFLGMRRNGRKSVHGAYLMMGLWRFNGVRDPVVWLEEQNISDTIDQRVRPATRMYFYVEPHRFIQSHEKWKKSGIEVSEVSGKAYHLFDPDGNRINVFTC
ncbi:MAG: hypothetical protein K0Q73_5911 [Paenibacillus sp.]|nr:hypothetical protein [Paenibacillus sp.]